MREPWQREPTEESWSDPEAWRGEVHLPPPEEWHPDDAGEGWVWAGEDEADSVEEEDLSLPPPGWPEQLAGPEYWMYRRAA